MMLKFVFALVLNVCTRLTLLCTCAIPKEVHPAWKKRRICNLFQVFLWVPKCIPALLIDTVQIFKRTSRMPKYSSKIKYKFMSSIQIYKEIQSDTFKIRVGPSFFYQLVSSFSKALEFIDIISELLL